MAGGFCEETRPLFVIRVLIAWPGGPNKEHNQRVQWSRHRRTDTVIRAVLMAN